MSNILLVTAAVKTLVIVEQQAFRDAENVTLNHDASIKFVAGNDTTNIYNTGTSGEPPRLLQKYADIERSSGLETLRQHISQDASYDSNIPNRPKCSHNTRTRILKEIADWTDDPNPKYRMIWIFGPAGAGKSAIAQSAMQQAEKKSCLGASFFFAHDAEGRGNADRLFPTISYQLAQNIPELHSQVEKIVRMRPDLPSKSLETQFRELIDLPVRKCNTTRPYLVGIDGVDECGDDRMQEKFLTIIGESVKLESPQSPLRFIIFSRPEPRIQDVFKILNAYTQRFVLETSPESLDDILTYLRDEFADIRKRKSHFMRGILQPWPSESNLEELQKRSSGYFIYAKTVLRFVGEGENHLNPISQLNAILEPAMTPALRESPYPELDRLYLQVLYKHPNSNKPLLSRILMFFVAPRFHCFPDLLDDLLNVDRGVVVGSLISMNSLINFTESDSLVKPSTFHHASFRDFLLDPSRSGEFYIDQITSAMYVTTACINCLIRWIGEASL